MQENSLIKSAAASGTSTVVGIAVDAALNEYRQRQYYPDKYNSDAITRLNLLKTVYHDIYKTVPNTWVLSDRGMPHKILTDGTTWENYWKGIMSSKKPTDLRVDVEDILRVISTFLDKRHKKIGWPSPIKRGDVEDQFFGEMITWLINTLDSNVDKTIIKNIDDRREYLNDVYLKDKIFPKTVFYDKSVSKVMASKIRDMLLECINEVKKIEEKKFVVDKFGDILRGSELLLNHFLRAFSYFSLDLKDIDKLTASNVFNILEKSDTKYARLFLMFLQNSGGDRSDRLDERSDNEVKFDPNSFVKIISGNAKEMGLWVPMEDSLLKSIPEIFIAAYHVSATTGLIRQASEVLSEQGTARLFCNDVSREYFDRLLDYLKSEVATLMEMFKKFNEDSIKYVHEVVNKTREDTSPETPFGQYDRLSKDCNGIKYEDLQSHIKAARDKIKEFTGQSPKISARKRELFYRTIRTVMRAKGDHELADRLELMSRENLPQSASDHTFVSDKKDEELEESTANNRQQSMPGKYFQVSSADEGAVDEKEQDDSMEGAAAQNNQVDQSNFPNSLDLANSKTGYQRRASEQTAMLHETMKVALVNLDLYRNAFWRRLFRNNESTVRSMALATLFRDGVERHLDFSVFYDRLSDFIESLRDESAKNKYKLKKYIAADIYCLARDLKEIFDLKKYRHLILNEAKENEQLRIALHEFQTNEKSLMASLEERDESLKTKDRQKEEVEEQLRLSRSEFDIQLAASAEKEREMKNEIETYKMDLEKTVQKCEGQSQALADSQRIISEQTIEIASFQEERRTQEKKINDLTIGLDLQGKRMSTQEDMINKQGGQISDLEINMALLVAKAVQREMAKRVTSEPKNSNYHNKSYQQEFSH